MKKEENIKNYNNSNLNNNLLLEIALIISKNVKILLYFPFIITLLSITYLFLYSSPIYTANTKILSSNNSSSSKSELIDVASQFGIQLPNNNSQQEYIYPELIKSRTIAKSLLKRKFSTIEFGPNKTLLQIITYGYGQPPYGIDTLLQYGIMSVISMVDINKNP